LDTRSQRRQTEPTETAAGKGGTAGGLPSWLVARGLIPETSPKRAFAAATFINQIGKGLFISRAALFFTRSVGLPVAQVGFALGAAALIGLAAGIPVGRWRPGRRRCRGSSRRGSCRTRRRT
jgi:hypothetical protein